MAPCVVRRDLEALRKGALDQISGHGCPPVRRVDRGCGRHRPHHHGLVQRRSSGGAHGAEAYDLTVRVRLLGPIEVDTDDGHSIVFNAAKERSLLAALALAAGATVSTDSLISALWGDEPPNAARKTLQTYVWNLRQALGAGEVVTTPEGYRLDVEGADVDVLRFRGLVRKGDACLRGGRIEEARAELGHALSMWRGEALSGVANHTALAAEAARLEQERLGALEARVAADLAGGHHDDVVGELEYLVEEHPFRERLWVQLMVALYRSGRQADALAAYQRVRGVLREELGLEPGGELQRTEAAILRHELDQPPAAAPITGALDASIRPTPVRYARAADGVTVAFRSAGRGPLEILSIPGYIHHLDIWWNAPTNALVRSLTQIGRLTVFDKRGIGLSDRPETIDLDGWTLDALAVLDAAEIDRAVLLGVSCRRADRAAARRPAPGAGERSDHLRRLRAPPRRRRLPDGP